MYVIFFLPYLNNTKILKMSIINIDNIVCVHNRNVVFVCSRDRQNEFIIRRKDDNKLFFCSQDPNKKQQIYNMYDSIIDFKNGKFKALVLREIFYGFANDGACIQINLTFNRIFVNPAVQMILVPIISILDDNNNFKVNKKIYYDLDIIIDENQELIYVTASNI